MATLLLEPGYTRDDLVRQYRLESLKHHPDKNNNTPESTARFQEINEAYCTLLKLADLDDTDDADDGGDTTQHSYSNIFAFFIRAKFNNNSSIEAALMDIIANNYNKLLANLDKQTAVQIYEFMQEYADILYLRPEDMERMRSIVADKMKSDNLVILNPSLKDLIEHRVYRLEYEGQVFMVPLWHHEIYYPLTCVGGDGGSDVKDDSELIVRCILEDAPDYVHVDDLNNLTIHIRTSIQRAFDAGSITVSVIPDIFEFTIPASALSVARVQTYTHSYRGQAATIGIPQINSKHLYDASLLGRVDVCIEMY